MWYILCLRSLYVLSLCLLLNPKPIRKSSNELWLTFLWSVERTYLFVLLLPVMMILFFHHFQVWQGISREQKSTIQGTFCFFVHTKFLCFIDTHKLFVKQHCVCCWLCVHCTGIQCVYYTQDIHREREHLVMWPKFLSPTKLSLLEDVV